MSSFINFFKKIFGLYKEHELEVEEIIVKTKDYFNDEVEDEQ